MKIFDFIKKIAKIPLRPKMRTGIAGLFGSSTTRNSKYYTGWVFLAVSTIAQDVAGIKLKLFKKDSKGNIERVEDHPALSVLHEANKYMTFYEVVERMQSNIELHGNEFWFVTFMNGQPSGIYPLRPGTVTPVAGQYDYVSYYEYNIDGEKIKVPVQNIMHFKQFNPYSDIMGLSTLEAARDAADSDEFAKQYNKNYFANDARPDVILQFPDTLSAEDEKRILEDWTQNYGGTKKGFRTAVASGGLEIKAFQSSLKDMEFSTGRTFNRDEIMMMFRVPLAVVGFTGNETYASAKAATYQFGLRTINPKMKRFVGRLNEFFIKLFSNTEGMYFDYESPVLEDRAETLAAYSSGLTLGWMSINDVRRSENLPEIENGDEVRVNLSLMPLGSPIQQRAHDPVSKMAEIAAERITKIFEAKKKEIQEQDQRSDREKRRDAIGEMVVKQRHERGLKYENLFEEILNNIWDGQKQRAINNLSITLNRKDWKVAGPNVLDRDFELKLTIDLITPMLSELTAEEALAAREFLGILTPEDVVITPALATFIERNSLKLAGEVTDHTIDTVKASLAAGLEAGEALIDLQKRVSTSTAFSEARSKLIAKTETIRSQGQAAVETWKESGVVERKIWYTSQSDRVCPWCDSLNGKTISLEEKFFNKGDSLTVGERTINLDYSDVESAPLHPGCECTILPEIETI